MESHICKYVNEQLEDDFNRLTLIVSSTTQNFEVKPKEGFLNYIKSHAKEQSMNN